MLRKLGGSLFDNVGNEIKCINKIILGNFKRLHDVKTLILKLFLFTTICCSKSTVSLSELVLVDNLVLRKVIYVTVGLEN